jgi:hypothetical protein
MGSVWVLKVDDLQLHEWKGEAPVSILSMFQERDKRTGRRRIKVHTGRRITVDTFEYAVPAADMRQRLHVLGYTVARTKLDFLAGLADEESEMFSPKAAPILDYESWTDAISTMAAAKLSLYSDPRKWSKKPLVQAIITDHDYSFMFCGSDDRFFVQAILDALPNAREVILDLTDQVDAIYDITEPVVQNAIASQLESHPVIEPIVLLTEGSSDTRALQAAMATMFPHLEQLYSFVDFEGVRAAGGTDVLCKVIRAFAGARLRTRMIAIFDNDTAGHAAMATLAGIQLPRNIRLMALPHCTLAKDYPTIGPQGSVWMDVNQSAAAIELYMGADALSDGHGGLRPVHWTAFDKAMKRYQGEVDGKREAGERFHAALAACATSTEARAKFPDMSALLASIFDIFAVDDPIDEMEQLDGKSALQHSRAGGVMSSQT